MKNKKLNCKTFHKIISTWLPLIIVLILLLPAISISYHYLYRLPVSTDVVSNQKEQDFNSMYDDQLKINEELKQINLELKKQLTILSDDIKLEQEEEAQNVELSTKCQSEINDFREKAIGDGYDAYLIDSFVYRSNAYNNCLEGKDPYPVPIKEESSRLETTCMTITGVLHCF